MFRTKALVRLHTQAGARFVGFGLLWVAGIILGAIARSEVLTVSLLVGGGVLFGLLASRRPPVRSAVVELSSDAIHIGNDTIPFARIREIHHERDIVTVTADGGRHVIQTSPKRARKLGMELRTATGLTDPVAVESMVGAGLGVPGWDDEVAWGIGLALATVVGLGAFSVLSLAIAIPLALALVAAFFVSGLPGRAVFGRDGVFVRWLWFRRFVPLREMRAVVAEGPGVRIVTDRGRLDIMGGWFGPIEAFRKQLIAAFEARSTIAEATAIVPRADLTARAWLEALRERPTSTAYRESTPNPETLWRIAEDPTADAERRIAASVTLVRVGASDAARLRVASNDVADPSLRAALRAVADEDDDSAIEAIEAIDGLRR